MSSKEKKVVSPKSRPPEGTETTGESRAHYQSLAFFPAEILATSTHIDAFQTQPDWVFKGVKIPVYEATRSKLSGRIRKVNMIKPAEVSLLSPHQRTQLRNTCMLFQSLTNACIPLSLLSSLPSYDLHVNQHDKDSACSDPVPCARGDRGCERCGSPLGVKNASCTHAVSL